jgi:hypothetical protein
MVNYYYLLETDLHNLPMIFKMKSRYLREYSVKYLLPTYNKPSINSALVLHGDLAFDPLLYGDYNVRRTLCEITNDINKTNMRANEGCTNQSSFKFTLMQFFLKYSSRKEPYRPQMNKILVRKPVAYDDLSVRLCINIIFSKFILSCHV